MKQQVANYTVIIEKQKRLGTKKDCYMAYVPTLDIATDANTFDEIEKEIKSLIQFHLESLVEEEEEIPVEPEQTFVTKSQVDIPKGAIVSQ